ncbi:hypothetical protein CesoFtcFv8_021359 [Champsocephalus esox]|uniref:Uncharacterized protein n=1 Tax=Champsocephalus esox TaxID=159716 RepID=A0AAN8BDF9_9TELE|nr:hypothetical protein CesoFtcFv8_021359 [Champsocephalus esox]
MINLKSAWVTNTSSPFHKEFLISSVISGFNQFLISSVISGFNQFLIYYISKVQFLFLWKAAVAYLSLQPATVTGDEVLFN